SLRERTLMRERIEELRSTLRTSVPKGHEVQMSHRGFPSGKTSETFQPLKTFLEPLANIRDSQKLFDMFVEAIAEYFTVNKGALVLAGKDSDKLSVKAFTGLDIELINQMNQMKEFDTRHGVYRWLWEKDRILITEELGTDELVLVEREAELLKAKLCVPLSIKDREKPLGYVSLGNKLTGEPYSTEEQKFIFALARYAAAAIENALLFEETREKAIKDDLTQLYRRNYYEQRLETELERSKRYGRSLSVAIFDIDNFKSINETYGHLVGDRVLKAVARLMLRRSRSTDVVGRYGGEEFIAILPETEEKDAHNYCERVRLGVKELGKEEVLPADLTVSGGKTSFDPDKDTAQTIIKRADDALLEAKRSGKDRIRNL
ncbi:MAG: sensor domain-containing diguanylate cyclase, partial [Candidatus Hydrogenedentota bacterium]